MAGDGPQNPFLQGQAVQYGKNLRKMDPELGRVGLVGKLEFELCIVEFGRAPQIFKLTFHIL